MPTHFSISLMVVEIIKHMGANTTELLRHAYISYLLWSILILYIIHLCLDLQRNLSPGILTKILYSFLMLSMLAASLDSPLLLDLIVLIILGGQYTRKS
jgi:hypothetical protein